MVVNTGADLPGGTVGSILLHVKPQLLQSSQPLRVLLYQRNMKFFLFLVIQRGFEMCLSVSG